MLPRGAVLHVVQHLRPGGLEVMALELSRAQSSSCPAGVVSLEGSEEQALAAWPRLEDFRGHLVFLGKKPGLSPRALVSLAACFRRLRPACVHTHHAGPLLYGGHAARLAGVPRLVHTEHDAWHLSSRRRRMIVSAAVRSLRPVMTADAPHVAESFALATGLPRPAVVLNGIDTSVFSPGDRSEARQTLGIPDGRPVVGAAARLEEVKGIDQALRALARIPSPRPVLAVAGTGSQETALRLAADDLGIAGDVLFLGQIERMQSFYRALDAFCLPSRNEGLPLSLLEAQACGVPAAAFAVGGTAAAVDPVSGILVPAGDEAALAEAITALLSGRLGDPRAFVCRAASLERAAADYLRLYFPPERGR